MKTTKNLNVWLVISMFLLLMVSTALAQTIYVDADATGSNNGSSWIDAYNYLQDALMFASAKDEIRVAQGVYRPDEFVLSDRPNQGREETFQLINGVTIKGGYAGFGEADPNARDFEVYETILSGDLDGNDVDVNDSADLLDEPTRAENSYHVVTSSGTDETAILDGFTITGGYANGEGWPVCLNRGGGIYSDSGSPTLMNCTISGNSAENAGGMCCHGGSPTLNDCTFSGNSAQGQGGALKIAGSPRVINCSFVNNSALIGGAIFNMDSWATLSNCVFNGNSASWWGGAWFSVDSETVLSNCTFSGNYAPKAGGIGSDSDYSLILTNSILWGNSDSGGMDASAQIDGGGSINYCCIQGGLGGTGNIGADPCFVDLGYWAYKNDPNIVVEPNDPNAAWVDGDYHLLGDSPCIDAGDPDYVAEPNETDLDGRPRVIGGRIDMGAYEYSPPIPAEVRIVPRSINLASKGKWITCYIYLPEEYNLADIEPNSVFLEDEIQAESILVDEQEQVAIAKFSRSEVQSALGGLELGDVELAVSGELSDGTRFEGTDTIRIIDKGRKK